jgi:hypothetical protein
LAEDFLKWFNTLWDNDEPVTLAEVGRFVGPSIQFYLNGDHLADGIQAYLERLNALKHQCAGLKIDFPLKTLLGEGDWAAVHFSETLTFHDGSVQHLQDAAFFKFNDEDKIVYFSDLFTGKDPVKSNA